MTDRALAGRGRRMVATLIDAVLVPVLTLFLVMVFGVVEDAEDYVDNWWIAHVFGLAVLSYLLLNGYWLISAGQTLGKRLLGIALVSSSDSPVAVWRLVFVRGLFFGLMFLLVYPPLALLPLVDHLMIFGKRRRCLHDLAAGTIVVRVGSQSSQE